MQNNIRTDLAVELNEEISRKAGRLKGIIVNQQKDKDTGIEVTSLKVTNKAGERMIGKPMGTYITIEARRINEMNEDYNNNVTQILKNYISACADVWEQNNSFAVILPQQMVPFNEKRTAPVKFSPALYIERRNL